MIEILAILENIDHDAFDFAKREIELMLGLMRPAQPRRGEPITLEKLGKGFIVKTILKIARRLG